MRSLTLIDVVFWVAVAAASSLAVSQEALALPAAGKSTSGSPRQTAAPGRNVVSQPGTGGSTLQPGSGGGTLQPGSGGGTLQPGSGGGTLGGESPTSTAAPARQ